MEAVSVESTSIAILTNIVQVEKCGKIPVHAGQFLTQVFCGMGQLALLK